MEAWIEIYTSFLYSQNATASLPAWKRGLKSLPGKSPPGHPHVASCVEAWIEIVYTDDTIESAKVASCVEAWIEIIARMISASMILVASCVEAWIEITLALYIGIDA